MNENARSRRGFLHAGTATGMLAASGLVARPERGGSSPSARPQVLLAWDGTGDFGPQTPGTKTSGWKEALEHCVAHGLDLYVKGGYGGQKAIYHTRETIRLPAAQDFRIDGGVFVINYVGDPMQDAVVMDSAMNCDYQLGVIVYGGKAAALRIRPEKPVPVDGFPIVVESQVRCQTVADPHPFQPGPRPAGTGLILDPGVAGINYNLFYFASILNFNTCIDIRSPGSCYRNQIACEHLHTNAHTSTLALIGPEVRHNSFRLGIGVDQGATGVTGVVVSGSRNSFDLAVRGGGFADHREVVLRAPAEGNEVHLHVDGDPLSVVKDEAQTPTNQVTWTGGSARIHSVQATAGSFEYPQRLYPAMVNVRGGAVTSLTLRRDGDEVPVESPVMMSVGDRLVVASTSGPTLVVVPMKAR